MPISLSRLRLAIACSLATALAFATAASADPLFLSPTSFFNAPLAPLAPIDPQSAQYVASLNAEVARDEAANTGPWIDNNCGGIPVYTVGPSQPTVTVHEHFSYVTQLQDQFDQVPLPPDARPTSCGDHELAVWQPSTNTYWDFWKLSRGPAGWEAWWGGRMQQQSSNPGYFPGGWGASATGLPLLGGMIRLSELQAGIIPHAIAMAIPFAKRGSFAWPAQRSDGVDTSPGAIPEGIRFRLDPTLNIAAMHLPPVTKMIALAAQQYGMVVRDQSAHVVGVYAEQPLPGQPNPYPALYGGKTPLQIMAAFPWSHLQAMTVTTQKCAPLVPIVGLPLATPCGLPYSLLGLPSPSSPSPSSGSSTGKKKKTKGGSGTPGTSGAPGTTGSAQSKRVVVRALSCSVRTAKMRIRAPKGARLRTIRIYKGRHRVRTIRHLHSRHRTVRLRRDPHRTMRVKVVSTSRMRKSGRSVHRTRRWLFRACKASA